MSKSRYDLLILTHNRLDDVRRCFESLMSTLEREYVHCVVLDNASTDGTTDYVSRLPGVCSLLYDKNLGVAGGRARLIQESTAGKIVFLDSDTVIVDNNWLDVLDAALEPENVGLVGPGGSFMREDWSNFIAARPDAECDVIAGFCQMFKSEVLKVGVAFDLSYGKFWTEDSDFCMQIREAGYDIWCTPCGVMHEPGHSGDAANEAQLQRNLALFRSKWQGKGLTKVEGAF
jgi:GT2 family glycosyltransferase